MKIPKHDDKNPRGRRDVKERAESEDITAVEEGRLGPRKNKQGMVSLVGLQEREKKKRHLWNLERPVTRHACTQLSTPNA